MGLGIGAVPRSAFLNRYGASSADPSIVGSRPVRVVDVPASVRKIAPPTEVAVLFVARRLFERFTENAASVFFAFDTPGLHNAMRDRVAASRAKRKLRPGLHVYPKGMAAVWEPESKVSLERAMASSDAKAAYYGVLYEALKQVCLTAVTDTALTVVIDGPRLDDNVWTATIDATADGRSRVTTETTCREAAYGEADLKVQWFCCKSQLIPPDATVVWHTIDTDSIAQAILSREELDFRRRRLVIHLPSMGKDKPPTVIDASRLPPKNATAIVFALLVPGCDYSDSALGFGLDPSRILDATAAPTPFQVTDSTVVVDRDGLVALLAMMSKGAPRKLYLCSEGFRHKTKQAAIKASTPDHKPKEVLRNVHDLAVCIEDILRTIYYWRFGGCSRVPAGPVGFSASADGLFGADATLAQILEGTLDCSTLSLWQAAGPSSRSQSTSSPSKMSDSTLSPPAACESDSELEAAAAFDCAGEADSTGLLRPSRPVSAAGLPRPSSASPSPRRLSRTTSVSPTLSVGGSPGPGSKRTSPEATTASKRTCCTPTGPQ